MLAEAAPVTRDLEYANGYATMAHFGQYRADAMTPYIEHPRMVARLLALYGYDVEVQRAGLLHDVLEDNPKFKPWHLLAEFGQRVTDLVIGVTGTPGLPARERADEMLRRMIDGSDELRALKMCDRLCNVRDAIERPPATWSLGKQRTYFIDAQRLAFIAGAASRELAAALLNEASVGLWKLNS